MRRQREILEGIEYQFERGNEVMTEVHGEFHRNREAHERNLAVVEQMVGRNERSHREIVNALLEQQKVLVKLSADVEAHTAAVWKMLDRLPPDEEST